MDQAIVILQVPFYGALVGGLGVAFYPFYFAIDTSWWLCKIVHIIRDACRSAIVEHESLRV